LKIWAGISRENDVENSGEIGVEKGRKIEMKIVIEIWMDNGREIAVKIGIEIGRGFA
jgi:hypothetical protein